MTRLEKIAELEVAHKRSPSNTAIEKHLNKVRAMNDIQFIAHLKAQEEMISKFRSSGAAKRMMKEIIG